MSNEETGKLVRVDSVATKGKKIEISFSNGEKIVCSPDSYSEFRLYVGKEVGRLEFNKIKDYVRMESLYAYALGLIGVRMRSKKEVRDKLIAKGADLETHRKIIFRLEKQGLLNDKEFAFAYAENLGDLVIDALRALDVAGCAEAHGDAVLALGSQGKLCVERGNAVDFFHRDAGPLGDHGLNLDGQITVDLLGLLHDGHQAARLILEFCNDLPKLLFLLLRPAEGN